MPGEPIDVGSGLGIPSMPTDKEASRDVMVSWGAKVSSRWFIELLLVGEDIAWVKYMLLVLRDCYRMGFLTADQCKIYMDALHRRLSPILQKRAQEEIKTINKDIVLALASQVDSVVKDSGMLQIALKCPKLQEQGITTPEKMHEFCRYQCGQMAEDFVRARQGRPPECPLTPPLFDILGDPSELPGPNYFETVPRLRDGWWEIQAETTKEHVRKWRSIDHTWRTQKDLLDEWETWHRKNRIGKLVNRNLFEPLKRFTRDLINELEDEKWLPK
jgi:hypothetical protein